MATIPKRFEDLAGTIKSGMRASQGMIPKARGMSFDPKDPRGQAVMLPEDEYERRRSAYDEKRMQEDEEYMPPELRKQQGMERMREQYDRMKEGRPRISPEMMEEFKKRPRPYDRIIGASPEERQAKETIRRFYEDSLTRARETAMNEQISPDLRAYNAALVDYYEAQLESNLSGQDGEAVQRPKLSDFIKGAAGQAAGAAAAGAMGGAIGQQVDPQVVQAVIQALIGQGLINPQAAMGAGMGAAAGAAMGGMRGRPIPPRPGMNRPQPQIQTAPAGPRQMPLPPQQLAPATGMPPRMQLL